MKVPAAGQRGGFVMGLVVGLLLGLALALGVALYITKAPVPFINKVPQRTAEQDNAEIERNRNWDPNGALGTRPVPRVAAPSASGAVTGTALPPPWAPAGCPKHRWGPSCGCVRSRRCPARRCAAVPC